ncbi:winged helix-turn-helix transcriptional regulator [Enterococcus termitis]|jgi:DNA-binding HxlR family transcriptional regulator|uniref:Transcriptional regulator n=1 Tax=Enterococcus termitis TaxID=332950 RepID=A0A1E5GD75_9ENTE|nr:helix-turn-helix domain-containing protein [Enterococcus termitis]OEG10535.1 transcriptional regulator [Enterococcus termitis]OJG97530.1 transcriptional regulator [Enterococcus termitis]
MKLREEFTCPVELTHDMIKGKWKTIILWLLRKGPISLANLERKIEGITQKMLLSQLKELIEFGFVEKKEFAGYPLRVEYFLSYPKGHKIIAALEIMQEIGIDYMKKSGNEAILKEKGII